MELLRKRGQSTGEYAILFAIVLGAVFAVQNYVRNRIASTVQNQADFFLTNVGEGGGAKSADITVVSDSESGATATMTGGGVGAVTSDSEAESVTTATE